MSHQVDGFVISNEGAGSYAFTLLGGLYSLVATGTWGGGNLALEILGPDGSTYVSVLPAITASGYATLSLPKGAYKFVVTTATAVYAALLGIPS